MMPEAVDPMAAVIITKVSHLCPQRRPFFFPDTHSLWSDHDPSEGRRPYRYFLRRLENKVTGLIEPDKPPMVFVLLNPQPRTR